MQTVVIALGGNALQEKGKPATAESQLEVTRKTCAHIARIVTKGYRVALAHGNGPQVGRILLQNEHAAALTPSMPFDVCGAMSQGSIGYHIQQAMEEALRLQGSDRLAVTLVTQVLVDARDPRFGAPSKPVGPFYSRQEAEAIARERGYVMKEDAGRGFRRVVASPQPLGIVEIEAVRVLLREGFIPIAVGGGGIPVVREEDGTLRGVAAVIDKDLAGERLAEDLDADLLLILTAVEGACLHYGTPEERALGRLTAREAERHIREGHFAAGSMLPKMEAAARFARSRPGRAAIIASLEQALPALEGRAGTRVEGAD